MSLRWKFALIISGLALIVLANAGVSAFGLLFLQRELAWPLESMAPVQRGLHQTERLVHDQALALGGPTAEIELRRPDREVEPPSRERFDRAHRAAIDRLGELERQDSYLLRSGISTSRNLGARLRSIGRRAHEWFDGQNQSDPSQAEPSRAAALDELHRLHELIEAVESRIIEDAALSVSYERGVRVDVITILAASLAIVVACGWIGTRLIGRWVLRPVERLREAAVAFGRGELAHRVTISTHDEFGRLASEMNDMASTISRMQGEAIERERLAAMGEVVRRIVHNLRNPLAGVRSLAELTRLELPSESPLREHQSRIVSTLDRFEGWLKEVLSATTPKSLSLQNIPLNGFFARCIEPLRPLADANGINLTLHDRSLPTAARFDPAHIEHAIVALVTNALQHTPAGGEVHVRIETIGIGETPSLLSVSIADTGPGVPLEALEQIFRPYFTTRPGGTGIGLALAKQVAEAHGGSLTVSQAGQGPQGLPGAEFVLRIPLAAG